MLKTQLHSKQFQLATDWYRLEDPLTGDFFGVLDYLPREPYLFDFLRNIERLNERDGAFELEQVNWHDVEMMCWARCRGHNDSTEPDVVLCSNRWIIVVEVKLGSGLGANQPWREYQVGQQIAEDRGLSRDAVHYVILSRDRLDAMAAFHELKTDQREELESHSMFLRWAHAVAHVDTWLRHGVGERRASENEIRMLSDLHFVLRKRKTLWFHGFSFPNQQPVEEFRTSLFCPERFSGYLRSVPIAIVPSPWLHIFRGFLRSIESVNVASRAIFCSSRFGGFLSNAITCAASRTMVDMHTQGDVK